MLAVRIAKRLREFTLDLDFRVGPEILVLFGPSGSGKTTLLRLIAGLDRPDAGEIRLGGRTLYSRAERVDVPPRDRRCGFVFQSLSLFPHLDVLGNIRYGVRDHSDESRRRLERLMDTFGIGHLPKRFPSELSGGEQQRVALARALMAEPDVLLLDEPFSAVDYATRVTVYEELLAAHAVWRIPFVLVTHERAEAERLGDRILHLRAGRETEPAF